ncbi:MAG TPA: hypothetical protein VIM69_09390 [Opitutaceae bacterium]
MALPELLIPLMDWTLEAIWTDVRKGRSRDATGVDWAAYCGCLSNPLTGYFLCAKDTFVALFEKEGPQLPPMSPGEKQMCSIELMRALDRVAAREIETFCSVCQKKQNSSGVQQCSSFNGNSPSQSGGSSSAISHTVEGG